MPLAGQPGNELFDAIDAPEPTAAPGRRRRRGKGWLSSLIVFLVLGGGVALGSYFAWPTIKNALESDGKSGGQKHKDSRDEFAVRTNGKDPKPRENDLGKRPGSGKNPDTVKKPNTGKKGDPLRSEEPAPAGNSTYPRRAMLVSVHNYLYANPTHGGIPGPGSRNIAGLKRPLTNYLRIPPTQILHLSDSTEQGKERPPLKGVIQEGVRDFLAGCRSQDRILLFFVGHYTEIGDEAFLVPIEGELGEAKTLIPLKWFYAELEKCRARQKVFVVDVARFSPTEGQERPGGDKMSAKFEGALKNPPPGVQVWTACLADQQSYETDYAPMGLFLDTLWSVLASTKPGQGYQGKITRPNDLFPLEALTELINKGMAAELKSMKVQQVCKVYGKDRDNGGEYNPSEPLAAVPQLPKMPDKAVNAKSRVLVKAVLDEIGTPAVKVSRYDNGLSFDLLPVFADAALEKFAPTNPPEDSKLRPAIMRARAVLWAVAADNKIPTGSIASEVQKIKADLGVNLSVLKDGYRAPAKEKDFKDGVLKDERQVAKIMGQLFEVEDELLSVKGEKEKESMRWQANYDFILARVQAQIAYLFEYQSMLGAMRKEYPPREEGQGGWKLASRTELSGDTNGKKRARASHKTLDEMITAYAGTPWEVLAKREKLTALGLEWKATR